MVSTKEVLPIYPQARDRLHLDAPLHGSPGQKPGHQTGSESEYSHDSRGRPSDHVVTQETQEKVMSKTLNYYRYFLGIDPGKFGGLVCLSRSRIITCTPMPETTRDLCSWFQVVCLNPETTTAVIERVRSRPCQSSQSGFTSGRGYGRLEAFLTVLDIRTEDVTPQTWMRALSIPPKKKTESKSQWKERLRAKAQQLFPTLDLWEQTKGKQLAVADALLIAEFCRRQNS